MLIPGLVASLVSATETPVQRQRLTKIHLAHYGRNFITENGKPFIPFGVTYFRPGTGWAPQVWKQFDPEATRKDFARLRELGANCVRVFLSFGSFYEEPGRLSTNGLAKFDQFLALAEEAGLYVQPTGPDHWEGRPDWAREDRYASEKMLSAQEQFWKLFATRYCGRNVIFAYELLNEPEVGWDTPELRAKWRTWRHRTYENSQKLQPESSISSDLGLEPAPVPARNAPPSRELLEYQHFREEIAEEWTSRQVAAIKLADPHALVTVGLIQWSVPICLAGPFHYSAFRPEQQAHWLDFLEMHFYPLADGFYEYSNERSEARNLAYLECVIREVARCGKPVVLGEFGWYGGGKPACDGGQHSAATEEQQARWCRRAVETSSRWVSGWFNWGFYDHAGANDVTELTGLLTAEGKVKAWGREFAELAKQFQYEPPPGFHLADPALLDWDRNITDKKAMDGFWESYFQAFQARVH